MDIDLPRGRVEAHVAARYAFDTMQNDKERAKEEILVKYDGCIIKPHERVYIDIEESS